jgi:hypothetical protein
MKSAQTKKDRKNEQGAAMVMVLLITFLLLAGCMGLLLGAAVNTANVTDATAEQQAYYAAESGIQSAVNVLRRNVAPNPLLDASKSSSHPNNKIDYYSAIQPSTSNKPGDTDANARLSRWLNYNYTPPGATNPDRVSLGQNAYDPLTGSAFSVTVGDPDNPNKILDLTVTGSIGDSSSTSKTFEKKGGFLGLQTVGTATIQYIGTNAYAGISAREIDATAGLDLGSFKITTTGEGATVPDTPFEIVVKMTAPTSATVRLKGTLKSGVVTSTSVGNLKIALETPIPSQIGVFSTPSNPVTPNAPNVNAGLTKLLNNNGFGANLGVKIILAPPRRLLIRSTGYGSRGARKVMEAIVRRDNFDGLVPATVTLVGSLTNSIFKSSSGSSQQVSYSGNDLLSGAKSPYIATIGSSGGSPGGLLSGLLSGLTGALNLTALTCPGCTTDTGSPAAVGDDETPDFLKSAGNLDKTISELKETAKSQGRYFTDGNSPPDFGNNADGTGITFIDGDAILSGSGGGTLVVTGKLTLDKAFDYHGTIFVTGQQGVRRTGSGTGSIEGNLIVAPYKTGDLLAGFLPPKYDITGGAVSTILYNASGLLLGSNNYNTIIVGVVEK